MEGEHTKGEIPSQHLGACLPGAANGFRDAILALSLAVREADPEALEGAAVAASVVLPFKTDDYEPWSLG